MSRIFEIFGFSVSPDESMSSKTGSILVKIPSVISEIIEVTPGYAPCGILHGSKCFFTEMRSTNNDFLSLNGAPVLNEERYAEIADSDVKTGMRLTKF